MKIGDKLPALTGTTADGAAFALEDARGEWLVVYFYPKDNTPGCTTEAGDFRDLAAAFRARNARIVGVSRDSSESHARFAQKHDLPFTLIADTDETWCRAFDVIHEKNLYGKKHLGIVRSTFLIDPTGRLAAEWRKVRVAGHAMAVLEALPPLAKKPA